MVGPQKVQEIIKALAYGETAEQIAEVEDVTVADVKQIQQDYAVDIDFERNQLKKAGYIHE